MPKKNSELSQYLESLSSEELKEEIRKFHKLFPGVREYYQVQLQTGGEEQLLAKYKKIIKDEFMPDRGLGRGRLSAARKAVADFARLSANGLNVPDIMIYYVEMGVIYTNTYGDINEQFYISMENMYEKAADLVIAHHMEYQFIERFKKIVEDTDGIGWGFYDELKDIFLSHFPEVPIRNPR